jgi:hypothetical protein
VQLHIIKVKQATCEKGILIRAPSSIKEECHPQQLPTQMSSLLKPVLFVQKNGQPGKRKPLVLSILFCFGIFDKEENRERKKLVSLVPKE